MISFKEYLTESRSAPLYHATSLENVDSIISNGLKPSKVKNNFFNRNGISFSRDLRSIKRYVESNGEFIGGQVIFQFNQNKLTQRYQLKPFDYYGSFHDEFLKRAEAEEFLITDKPLPVTPYIDKVFILPREGEPKYYDDDHGPTKQILKKRLGNNKVVDMPRWLWK